MKKLLVGIVILVVGVIGFGQAKPAAQPLPGRVPMWNSLLAPSAEWNAYYDVAPEGEKRLYWTTKCLLDVAREQAANIKELDHRVKALEARLPKSEPNDPNGK